jgi:hypothetical protein
MAINPGLLPNDGAPIAGPGGLVMQEWRDFFLLLASGESDDELRALYLQLAERVAALEAAGGNFATLVEGIGISIVGQLTDPTVTIALNALLGNILDVDTATTPPEDGDALAWNAASSMWEPRAIESGVFMPMVTGEVYADQPRFMYFDDGSLLYVQVE